LLRLLEGIEAETEEVAAPLQFFVEVPTYLNFNNQTPPVESEISYKKIRGETVAGVAWHD
jgi:hypothetical protein